ncbi:hypothetical protein K443DRAFT_255663 [Laccaria amethystina LaAM-08-1]|uniref:Unplaced genomic scaffold K443scaffold_162, whole genome shotgun sequence n=1 Tax=Laccaria amethystina LaAM-08-1 TaxID=1095629 RepID=A0A0C9WX74_9AGAR|nr:hypothetical protein K443DRAFT_255663 [Laccaria amethystina LaAM-08-1]
MSGDGSYTGLHDSLEESPSYASLLAHILFRRENLSDCLIACISSIDLGGCSASDYTCILKNQVCIDSLAICVEQTCPDSVIPAITTGTGVSPNDGYGVTSPGLYHLLSLLGLS